MNMYNFKQKILPAFFFISMCLAGNAATGDFNGWSATTLGHNGLNSGKVEFTERNMTLEFWLYIDDEGGNNQTGVNLISNRHNGNNGFSVNLGQNSATSNVDVRFLFKNSKIDGSSDAAFTLFAPRSEFSDQWGHLAFVISSDQQKAYAYLNGQLYDVVEDFYTNWVGNRTTDELWIARWYSNDPTFYGKMAEIRIWNIARTAEEIAENYNQRLKGTETGLYIYYNFDNFDQLVPNVANPDINNGSLLPAVSWSEVHRCETLSAMPQNLSIAEGNFTWSGDADSFEVEVVEKTTGNIVAIDATTEKSYLLPQLDANKAYDVKVRAKTTLFYSDWASTGLNTNSAGLATPYTAMLNVYSEGASIIVVADRACAVHILALDGRMVYSGKLTAGKNTIGGLEKGFYIVNNHKVVVK